MEKPPEPEPRKAAPKPEKDDPISRLRKTLKSEIGDRSGVEDMYIDNSWNELLLQFEEIGSIFDSGPFKLSYMDKKESTDFVTIPGKETIVIAVKSNGPKEKIIQALCK